MTDLEYIFDTRFARAEMIEKVNLNFERFKETIEIAVSDKVPLGWRAAWILGHCTKRKDDRLMPYVDELIAAIKDKKDGHQRELIKLLIKLDLSEEHEGKLFDICLTIWETIKKSPSVRLFAFRYVAEVVKKYPDLKAEISFFSQPQYLESLSPGIRRGVEKTIKEIL